MFEKKADLEQTNGQQPAERPCLVNSLLAWVLNQRRSSFILRLPLTQCFWWGPTGSNRGSRRQGRGEGHQSCLGIGRAVGCFWTWRDI